MDYLFHRRKSVIERMINADITDKEVFIEFTRGTPVVVTDGPAGLSGSVKMVGFIPRDEFLYELTQVAKELIAKRCELGTKEVLEKLIKYFYDEEKMDFTRLGGLEMGFKHSWINIKATKKATLVFYTPPRESYEIRCDVEIHERGPVHEYLNALHDVFHVAGKSTSNFPAYVFKIREVYDQSASREGFGRLIFRAG